MLKTLARDRDKTEILRRLAALRPDSRRRWGRMTAHQMVCHLSDGYRILTGQRDSPLAASPLPRPLMKGVALYVPLRWPRALPTTADLNQEIGGSRPRRFDDDLADLVALVDRITGEPRLALADRLHPIFGTMSAGSWLRWAYLHADHHLRQFGL